MFRSVPRFSIAVSALSLAALGGCAFDDYRELPLDPDAILAELEARRTPTRLDTPVTLAEATTWLERGPNVQAALSDLEVARARAAITTPLPNPSIEIGYDYALDGGTPDQRGVPLGGIGFAIPLGDRRACRDALRRLELERARVGAVTRLREEWLALRTMFLDAGVAERYEFALADAEQTAATAVGLAERLVEAGRSSADRVAAFELELARARAARGAFESERTRLHTDLAIRTGTSLGDWPGVAPPDVVDIVATPEPVVLRDALVANNPELARLRADHAIAEGRLRLAIAEQYPDLRIGPSVGGEIGETRTVVGLSLGIELPLFDRNQLEIATARAERSRCALLYERYLNRALTELEGAVARLRLAIEQLRIQRERVGPIARRAFDLARRAIDAGRADTMDLLLAAQSARRANLEQLTALRALHAAWGELERITGTPLLRIEGSTMPSVELRNQETSR
ncbi:MAG: TolC family protein [Planctomycetes bacterium]|nr:TolC family protein [Planctomycetota bacterium]